jgi:long-subunit fatty acid transport protein
MKVGAWAVLSAMGMLALTSHARANTPEDMQGIMARTNAMGGAGTALTGDYGGAYYNPATLSYCPTNLGGVDLRQTFYALDIRGPGAAAFPNGPKVLRNQTRITTGACLQMPYNVSFGLSFGLGLQDPMTLDQTTPNNRPMFAMYGEALEQLSVAIGVAYRPVRQFSIGFGGSILVNSDLAFAATVPIAYDGPDPGTDDDPLGVGLEWHLQMNAAPYIGVLVSPIDQLRFGVTYRGPLYHNLSTPALVGVTVLDLELAIPLRVQSFGWYSPRQIAIGVSGQPTRELTIAADVTYYAWHFAPGPFLYVNPDVECPPGNTEVACALNYPAVQQAQLGYRDIWVPRIGGELKVLDGHLAIRGGYAFRPSAITIPDATRPVNLLDGAVHSISVGFGYRIGRMPNEAPRVLTPEEQAELDAELAAEQAEIEAEEAERAQELAAAAERGEVVEDPEVLIPEGGELAQRPPEITASVDVFFRANMMPRVVVPSRDFTFGGNVYDLGLSMSLGWY